MLTQCTNPSATFYQADLFILRALERNGVDIPCDILSGLTAGFLAGITIITVFAAYSILITVLR